MTGGADLHDDWRKMLQAADLSRSVAELDRQHRAEVRRLLLDFLEVLDGLDRLAARGRGASAANLRALRRQLRDRFRQHGVRFFVSLRRPFDPERHEAVESRPHATLEPGTVVEEVRAGCEWQGELLRAAQAVISRKP